MTRFVLTTVLSLCLGGALLVPALAQQATGDDTPSAKKDDDAEIKLRREGDRLVDVVGRVENLKLDMRTGTANRSVFRPVDGNLHYILLENQLLERLEKVTAQGEVLIKVSGQVTEYNGKNFLLLTRAAVKRSN